MVRLNFVQRRATLATLMLITSGFFATSALASLTVCYINTTYPCCLVSVGGQPDRTRVCLGIACWDSICPGSNANIPDVASGSPGRDDFGSVVIPGTGSNFSVCRWCKQHCDPVTGVCVPCNAPCAGSAANCYAFAIKGNPC